MASIHLFGPQTAMVVDSNRIAGANPATQLPGSGVTFTPFSSGQVGHTGSVVPPPPVVPPVTLPVVPPPVTPPVTPPPAVSELPHVDPASLPAAAAGFADRRVREPSTESWAQPYRDHDGMGAFRTVCGFSHMNWEDALVFPGRVDGSPHVHTYIGNTLSSARSAPESILASGNSTCRGGIVTRQTALAIEQLDRNDERARTAERAFTALQSNL